MKQTWPVFMVFNSSAAGGTDPKPVPPEFLAEQTQNQFRQNFWRNRPKISSAKCWRNRPQISSAEFRYSGTEHKKIDPTGGSITVCLRFIWPPVWKETAPSPAPDVRSGQSLRRWKALTPSCPTVPRSSPTEIWSPTSEHFFAEE